MADGKKATDWSGVIIAASVTLPILILCDAFGVDEGRGRAAGIGAGVVVVAAKLSWELRHKLWYWMVLGVVSLAHLFLIFEVSWSNRRLSYLGLLPFAALDLIIVYGVIRLAQKFGALFEKR